MPVSVPLGFGQVVHSLRLDGDPDPMAVTYGVELQPDVPLAGATTAEELHGDFYANFVGVIANDYQLVETSVRYPIESAPGQGVISFVGSNRFTGGSATLPQNIALLVRKRSGLVGRRYRGRMYIPGIQENYVSARGEVLTQFRTDVNVNLAAFLAAVQSAGGVTNMVILHSNVAGAPIAPTVVTSLDLDPVVATQRRRLR
jgi:hypothetical protein